MIFIITGDIQTGKTTTLFEHTKSLNNCGGFLCPTVNGKRHFYNLDTQVSLQFELGSTNENSIEVGRFIFDKNAFSLSSEWALNHYKTNHIHNIVIDEIGKLELRKDGFYDLTKKLVSLDWTNKNLILVIRYFLLNEIIQFFKIPDPIITDVKHLNKVFVP